MKIPASSASRGEPKWTGRPNSEISPASGRYSPVRMFESVLLPAPFSPSSACTSPAAASKSTPSFATTPGNDFEIPRIETAGERGCSPAADNPLALGAADNALDEPVHPVQIPHAKPLALRDAQLAALVVQRPAEL